MILALYDPCVKRANICKHVLKSALHIDLSHFFVEHFKRNGTTSTKSARELCEYACVGDSQENRFGCLLSKRGDGIR